MNKEKLLNMLEEIGLYVVEDRSQFKGNSCNVRQWPVFRVWVNKSGKVTIKTRGIQRSFNINTVDELEKELRRFEIL